MKRIKTGTIVSDSFVVKVGLIMEYVNGTINMIKALIYAGSV